MGEEHKRRIHYSGKYPKKFEEKYKEHNPQKYKDTVEHVIQKGSTPAGMHISIMVQEILDILNIKAGEQGLDATLGYGGHTKRMLEDLKKSESENTANTAIDSKGFIVGLDVDPIESEKTVARLRENGFNEDEFKFELTNFRNIDSVAEKYGKFDFILADLGVSSMQIDNPERGFSYKIDGPLDLRMNPMTGTSAAQRLKEITQEEFVGMLIENSDEPYAEEIAQKVFSEMKKGNSIDTTVKLKTAIEKALEKVTAKMTEKDRKDTIKKSCQRTFQALRIDVNSEFEVLYDFLDKLPNIMKPGARVAILTFHSGEDRMVKKSFNLLKKQGIYSEICSDVIRPGAEEIKDNPRSKSTKLRWAIKA